MEEEMAKGKAKNQSRDGRPPPQHRSLRSRKRECQSDERSQTDDAQSAPHNQDSGISDTVEDAPLPQFPQAPVQESTMTSVQQYQAAQQSCRTKQDSPTEGKHAEATTVSLQNVTAKVTETQEEAVFTNPDNNFHLKGFIAHIVNDAIQSGKGKEEMNVEERNGSPSETCTEKLQVLLKTSEECKGSCATAFEQMPCSQEDCLRNFERNQETRPVECGNMLTADFKEGKKEAAVGLPAKKKRRMGMCDLTERERSHFLQTQMPQNGQEELRRAEKQIRNNTADLVAQGETVSSPPLQFSPFIPAGSVTEQNAAEIAPQPSYCGGNDRAEAEGCIAVNTSDRTRTICDLGPSNGKSGEAEGGTVPGPEQSGDTKSDPTTKEELFGKQQQDLQGCAAEGLAENPQQQMTGRGEGSGGADQSPANTSYSNPTQNEATQTGDAMDTAPLQVKSVTRRRNEKKGDFAFDAGDSDQAKASSTDTGGCGHVQLREAAMSPGGSERKGSCDPDFEPGACTATLNTAHPQTKDTIGPFESADFDYVSDSQLNIILADEEVIEREEDLGLQNCHDATDLICGLIRELSSLNQKVMATHRELENLRRSRKTSRSSVRSGLV